MKPTQCEKCERTINENGDWSTYQEDPVCFDCWEKECDQLWWDMVDYSHTRRLALNRFLVLVLVPLAIAGAIGMVLGLIYM